MPRMERPNEVHLSAAVQSALSAEIQIASEPTDVTTTPLRLATVALDEGTWEPVRTDYGVFSHDFTEPTTPFEVRLRVRRDDTKDIWTPTALSLKNPLQVVELLIEGIPGGHQRVIFDRHNIFLDGPREERQAQVGIQAHLRSLTGVLSLEQIAVNLHSARINT